MHGGISQRSLAQLSELRQLVDSFNSGKYTTQLGTRSSLESAPACSCMQGERALLGRS